MTAVQQRQPGWLYSAKILFHLTPGFRQCICVSAFALVYNEISDTIRDSEVIIQGQAAKNKTKKNVQNMKDLYYCELNIFGF